MRLILFGRKKSIICKCVFNTKSFSKYTYIVNLKYTIIEPKIICLIYLYKCQIISLGNSLDQKIALNILTLKNFQS